jgi:hypothetical protein
MKDRGSRRIASSVYTTRSVACGRDRLDGCPPLDSLRGEAYLPPGSSSTTV